MSPRKSKSGSTSSGGGGFEEGPSAFLHRTLDDERFDESVELMRSFNRILDGRARRKVIVLAQRLADEQADDHA